MPKGDMMLRQILIIVALATIVSFCVGGCKKSPDTPDSPTSGQAATKTAADYKKAAQKEITEENMDEELARLEKEVEADISTER
jgi:hypothetical protein